MKKLILLIFIFSLSLHAQDKLTDEERENEVIDYSNIKKVLKEDSLDKAKKTQEKLVKEIKVQRHKEEVGKHNYPSQKDFWSFASELWLVKNAPTLQWDFQKPQYGIADALEGLFEKLGLYNKRLKVLVVNSPNVTHFALPSNPNEYIFIISLPFMRTLDLTKVEIAILFLEDFYRIESGHFRKNLAVDTKQLGKSFFGNAPEKKMLKNVLKAYSKVIYKNGFSFQQQYEVTKKMDKILKSMPMIWSQYIKALNKIDRLIKTNKLYEYYNTIYPSPELQIKWLSPKKQVL